MPKLLANGINIHYQQVGEGPDVVMLHGLTGNLAVWHLKIGRVMKQEFRVTTYDLRGHGYTDVPRTGYTTGVMAEDLRGLLDSLGLERPYLVGHSFGADVILHFALNWPERVKKLIAIEPGLSAMIHVRKRGDWEGWRYWREVLEEFGIEVPRDRWFDPVYMFTLSLQVPKVYGPATGRPRKAEPLLRLLHETTMVQDYEVVDGLSLDRIPTIATPTLLVYGENSAFRGSYDYLKDALPNCQGVLLPATKWGHFGPLEHPELLIEYMREYFSA
ncbi:MAG TPA: alpha/beta hydrolase, partial [Dehalococcoidia bacterium]|nr:alpha/beta hydrolase [Dehalococcoidia bacterium]